MAQKSVRRGALVTGGAQGIGRATAQLLAARGYDVAIADIDAEAGRKTGLEFFRCDVAKEPAVRATIRSRSSR